MNTSAGGSISAMAGEDYHLAAGSIFENSECRESKTKELIEDSEEGIYTSKKDKINLNGAVEVKSNSREKADLH
jgi:hypothetical protein